MSIRVLRSNTRFAVRGKARLRKPGKRAVAGLLIEISYQGCRISNVLRTKFAEGELAHVEVDGCEPLEGEVRWAHDGFVGLRFIRPLRAATLDRLIDASRDEGMTPVPELSYGT